MNLVDNIDAIFKHCRSINDGITDITDIIDTVVACGIHFKDIGSNLIFYSKACFAFPAGITFAGRKTVNGLSKDLGAAGLTRSARTAKKISMRCLVIGYLIFQDTCYVILTADFVKCRGSPLSVKRLMHRFTLFLNNISGIQNKTIHPSFEHEAICAVHTFRSEQATSRHIEVTA